jgi:predicted  nucleic acid-binding Zn-ribbon protein
MGERLTSVEHDAKVYSGALHDLETQHEALQKQYRDLLQRYRTLEKEHQELQDKVEHGSRPDLRP